MPAAEVLALLENHHPAFRGKPRQVFQAAGKGLQAPPLVPRDQALSGCRKRICSSPNCFSSPGDGAGVSRSCARCVLGNAMTSRMESVPAIIATMRSKPNAMPPCGGAPYWSASSRNPNFCFASSAPIDSARNTFDCTTSRWMRTEPLLISAPFRTGAIDDRAQRSVRQILDDRRLHAVAALGDVVELDPGEALRAVDADEFRIRVDLAARELAALRDEQSCHAMAHGVGRAREHFEIHGLHRFGELGELEGHAQVGLVRAVFAHGVRVAHDRKRIGQGDAEHLLEYRPEHAFENGTDLRLAQEGGLAVDLREFGLAVGAQVLIAEALGDLVITVVSRDHEELLEQLR